jgi:plasmid stability protein
VGYNRPKVPSIGVIQMVELIMQIDERIYRELELRAQRRQRSVSEEAAELLRLALDTDRASLVRYLQTLHDSLRFRSLTSSPELIREDRVGS